MNLAFLEQWARRTRERDRRAVAVALMTASESGDHHPVTSDFLWSLAMDVFVLDAEDAERIDRLADGLVAPTGRSG